MKPVTERERLIVTIAELLDGVRHVAVGASSPIPAAASMLLRAKQRSNNGALVRLSILGSVKHNFFTNGSVELFDCAAQGRIDAFFLGGGQIDGQANINLVGVGDYPQVKVRWPGSFGSSFLYSQIPRVILFREEHSPRVLVKKVDFISAPGTSEPNIERKGGPHALLTSRALFAFDKAKSCFVLKNIHPGQTVADIQEATGFDFDISPDLSETPDPDSQTLKMLRGPVLDELAETYPQFAELMAADL